MTYRLLIDDSQGTCAVMTDAPSGKIGYEYRFKPMKATITKDAYDQADIHYYERKPKEPIPAGTMVTIDTWWQNFYGAYFKINYKGNCYDIKTSCVKINKA